MKHILFTVFICLLGSSSYAAELKCKTSHFGYKHVAHKHKEVYYQQAWCYWQKGIMEYRNSDKTRVDCLTKTHAVEFDFAEKWAESIGQALHYANLTGKRAKVVLILENPEKEMKYFYRVKTLSEKYNFEVEYITEEILNFKSKKSLFAF